MERADEFVDKFKQDSQDASHLLSVKIWYRRLRTILILGSFLLYFVAIIVAAVTNEPFERRTLETIAGVIGFAFIGLVLALAILLIEARRYELSEEELLLHEFALAVEAIDSDKPNYEGWETHMSNANKLLSHHEPDSFSKYTRDKVTKYISRVEELEPDEDTPGHFSDFYRGVLLPKLEERESKFSIEVEDIEEGEEYNKGLLATLKNSAINISKKARSTHWVPVAMILAIGAIIYITYEPQAGSFFALALLTAYSLLGGDSE